MIKHPVFYSDLMSGTVLNSPLLKSVRFKDDAGEYAEIENGMIVHVGALDGERDVHVATAPTATSKKDELGFVAGVCLFYDESVRHYEDEWVNEAGRPVRVYMYHPNDVFSMTTEWFDGTPAVGKFVDFQAGKVKMKVADSESDNTIGEIIDVRQTARYTIYGVRVK